MTPIWAAVVLVGLLLIDAKSVISLIAAGACVWFAYWVLSSHRGGGC